MLNSFKKLRRKLSLFIGFIFGIVFFVGCGSSEYHAKNSYFDGAVTVEYEQSRNSSTDDYLTFLFYEKGIYNISFSSSHGRGQNNIPQNFTKNIKNIPREIIIRQYTLPDFLRIMIIKDNKSEYFNFS